MSGFWAKSNHCTVVLQNIYLFQVKYPQFIQLRPHKDILEVTEVPLGVDLLSEGIRQVKLFQVDKIWKRSWMMHCWHNVEVIVVQNESFNIRHFVKWFSLNKIVY